MKQMISMPHFVLLFGYVLLLAHASAEIPGGLKNATIPHRQRHRVARHFAGTDQHGPSRAVKGVDRPDDHEIEILENWAGAEQKNIPGGTGTFNAVTAKWEIPGFIYPPDPGAPFEKKWEVTAFIAFDGGDSCPGLFQAGTNTYAEVDDNGNMLATVKAFAEWFPDPEVELDLYVDIGHVVRVQLKALSLSQGTAEIINLTTGLSKSHPLTAPTDYNICGLSADWIIENAPAPDSESRSPFLPFTPYNFEDCAASTTSGLSTNLADAVMIYMEDAETDEVLAFPDIVNDNLVTVYYGPPPER